MIKIFITYILLFTCTIYLNYCYHLPGSEEGRRFFRYYRNILEVCCYSEISDNESFLKYYKRVFKVFYYSEIARDSGRKNLPVKVTLKSGLEKELYFKGYISNKQFYSVALSDGTTAIYPAANAIGISKNTGQVKIAKIPAVFYGKDKYNKEHFIPLNEITKISRSGVSTIIYGIVSVMSVSLYYIIYSVKKDLQKNRAASYAR